MGRVPYRSDISLSQGIILNPDGINIQHVNIWADVEHGINYLTTSHEGISLIDVRGPINDENGPKGTYHNTLSVNKWVDVEHL